MPREGIERITLKLKSGDKQLSRRVVPGWEIGSTDDFTQRVFLASPGGGYLAWSDSKSGGVLVRDRRGRQRTIQRAFGHDYRFSADDRYLAAVRAVSGDNGTKTEVVVLDLVTGEEKLVGEVGLALWLEWVKDGVVVSHDEGDKRVITYLPRDGKPVQVASGAKTDLEFRFTTARRGHRAMYFFQKRAYVVDVEAAEADAREVGALLGSVDNTEMAPDGSEAAMVIGGAVYRWKEGGELVQVGMEAAHTVWYSADGAMLAWASLEKAVVMDGETKHELSTTDYDLHAMRFRGAELVVSMGGRALLWNPKTGAKNVIGKSAKGHTVQAADLYQGGVVLWTREIRRTDRRRAQQKNAAPTPFALARLNLRNSGTGPPGLRSIRAARCRAGRVRAGPRSPSGGRSRRARCARETGRAARTSRLRSARRATG